MIYLSTDNRSICELIVHCEIKALICRIGSAVVNFFRCIISAILPCWKASDSEKLANVEYLFLARQDSERCSQEGCCGGYSVEKADRVWQKLQKRAAPGISFDPAIYQNAGTIIGTCTAMSLEFATTYFRLRKESEGMNLNSEPFLDKLRSLKDSFEISSEEMRSRQIVFSSITVDPEKVIDASKSKIESCVKYHDFEIDYWSKELDISTDRDLLQQEIDSLPYGVYFVRMLEPKENHKLEAKGHSMIYVHEEEGQLFYDNNRGLEKVMNEPFSERLLRLHKQWTIPMTRFYRLKPE